MALLLQESTMLFLMSLPTSRPTPSPAATPRTSLRACAPTSQSCCTRAPTAARARAAETQLDSIKDFRAKIQPGRLYAAFAAYREVLGGRPYWLLKTKSEAKTGETIRVPGGRTIAKNQWFVEAQWYLSASDNQGSKRYKLLPEIVHVPPDTFIQEHELEWSHEGRGDGESILSDASHVALMGHNYSNVA
mmetsp:Transcript_33919/g.106473  ORF Transcript_33919/g.106473 Transcript_33919/m.106473 type:complete len:190 (-) Transcript_33919:11-580(-)